MEPSDPKNKNFRMELSELQKFHSQKKCLIFQEMELSVPNIEKVPIIFQKKVFLIFQEGTLKTRKTKISYISVKIHVKQVQ